MKSKTHMHILNIQEKLLKREMPVFICVKKIVDQTVRNRGQSTTKYVSAIYLYYNILKVQNMVVALGALSQKK